MNRYLVIIICTIFISCSEKKSKEKPSTNAPEYVDINTDNVDISNFEKDNENFIILFDGKSAKGWRGYGKDYLPPKWKIEDGCMKLISCNEEGGDIIFGNRFGNFVLELEWKISKAGNSGIFYLAREIQTKYPTTAISKMQPIFASAPEYQILDDENHPDARLGENGNRKSGSLYDIIAAEPPCAKPYGEWNKARIEVQNGGAKHYLNGIKIVEYSFLSAQWADMLQASKFSEIKWPLAFELMKNCGGVKHEGYIGLQDHGDEVSYRNIRIQMNQ